MQIFFFSCVAVIDAWQVAENGYLPCESQTAPRPLQDLKWFDELPSKTVSNLSVRESKPVLASSFFCMSILLLSSISALSTSLTLLSPCTTFPSIYHMLSFCFAKLVRVYNCQHFFQITRLNSSTRFCFLSLSSSHRF